MLFANIEDIYEFSRSEVGGIGHGYQWVGSGMVGCILTQTLEPHNALSRLVPGCGDLGQGS